MPLHSLPSIEIFTGFQDPEVDVQQPVAEMWSGPSGTNFHKFLIENRCQKGQTLCLLRAASLEPPYGYATPENIDG